MNLKILCVTVQISHKHKKGCELSTPHFSRTFADEHLQLKYCYINVYDLSPPDKPNVHEADKFQQVLHTTCVR